jgi:hypothetical protein
MNIFALHRCAKIAAAMHCDQHTKMLIEAAQMLYTHLHCLGVQLPPYVTDDGKALPSYKPFCPHHPVTLWLYGGRSHFFWLLDLGLCLCERHTARTGNVHKVEPRLRHLRDCVSARDLLDDCDVDEWLARLEARGEKERVREHCRDWHATVNAPEGCGFGVVDTGEAFVRAPCGAIDQTASYAEYYAKKREQFDMTWDKSAEPPAELEALWVGLAAA